MTIDAIKDGARQFIAGGAAGLVEVSLMHPLDLIKTRLQVGHHDKGMLDCVKKTFRNEGFLGFYKGILPPILAETPKRATKFFTFEQYSKLFSSPHISPAISLSMAGLFCGFTEAIVITPFEVVKVRLQAERGISLMEQKSAATMAREIIKSHGMGRNGLYRGLTATLGRHGVWNMIYFGLYHNIKSIVSQCKGESYPKSRRSYRSWICCWIISFNWQYSFRCGQVTNSGVVEEFLGPQPDPKIVKYSGAVQTIRLIYREEGFGALYKGLLPKVMRLGPGGAVMLIVYEHVYEWLKVNT